MAAAVSSSSLIECTPIQTFISPLELDSTNSSIEMDVNQCNQWYTANNLKMNNLVLAVEALKAAAEENLARISAFGAATNPVNGGKITAHSDELFNTCLKLNNVYMQFKQEMETVKEVKQTLEIYHTRLTKELPLAGPSFLKKSAVFETNYLALLLLARRLDDGFFLNGRLSKCLGALLNFQTSVLKTYFPKHPPTTELLVGSMHAPKAPVQPATNTADKK